MSISVNKSPLAGREGKLLQSRVIRDRLFKELDRNVALKVSETDSADTYEGENMSALLDCVVGGVMMCLYSHIFFHVITFSSISVWPWTAALDRADREHA